MADTTAENKQMTGSDNKENEPVSEGSKRDGRLDAGARIEQPMSQDADIKEEA